MQRLQLLVYLAGNGRTDLLKDFSALLYKQFIRLAYAGFVAPVKKTEIVADIV